MDLNVEHLQIEDLVLNGNWDNSMLENVFGAGFNSHTMKLGMVDPGSGNSWVLFPASNNNKLSTSVYHFLNNIKMESFHWDGWLKIWRLHVAPRVKCFSLLLLHERDTDL